jgi:flagellar motor switch protein FliM
MIVDMLFEIEIAGVKGDLHIMLPQAALRPVEKKLASGLLDTGTGATVSWREPLTKIMRDVTILCTAELGRTAITVRELMNLEVGDVLRLDRDPANPITIYLEGSAKLLGNPTLQHGNIAVEVVSIVQRKNKLGQPERTKSPIEENDDE